MHFIAEVALANKQQSLYEYPFTIAAANEEARINKIRAGVLTYLSFPPIFGWIIGIVSLKFQKDCMKNKVQIVITIAGMLISLLLTGLMIAGVLFEL